MVGLGILRKSDLFEGLSDDELVAIARLSHEETFLAGASIFSENEAARNLYIVTEGRVVILINIGRGRQTVVDTVCQNGSFGWSAMVPPFLMTGTARAVEKTQVVAIPGDGLRGLCKQSCGTCYTIMEKVAAMASARLRESRLQLISLIAQ
jgi:CRP-like cAMP-binding protein